MATREEVAEAALVSMAAVMERIKERRTLVVGEEAEALKALLEVWEKTRSRSSGTAYVR